MRLLLIIAIAGRMLAQQSPPPVQDVKPPAAADAKPPATQDAKPPAAADAKPPATQESKPAAAADAKQADVKPAESPVPTTESWLTGSIDVGYRWVGTGGNTAAYRSFVDLGSGPKLLGVDFTIVDPKHRAFDSIVVRANSWGGDPYQTFHLDARKLKLYDFSADYRDIAYFNALPSYADPLLSRGIILNEQSFDTRRKLASINFELWPGSWLIPYFAFDHASGSGAGVTTFVSDANEYPVPTTLDDRTNLYRGGVRIQLNRFHVTLEEGGTTFNNDQQVFENSGVPNLGNVSNLYLGQRLELTNLAAAYGIDGSSAYSKILLTANPFSWLDLYGQFLFSQPDSNVHYQQTNTGNFVLQSQLLFYTSQSYLVSAAAKLPHTTGSFGAEIRPLHRLRITQSWLTDRLHNSGSAATQNQLANAGVSQQIAAALTSSLVTNYNQIETNLLFDATSKLMLRGGYRYVWGDASDLVLPPAGLVSADQGSLRRNVGIGGLTYRLVQRLSLTAEAEVASSGAAYFSTSLYNYQKIRAQARYQALKSLSLTADFSALINENPRAGLNAAGVNYDYRAQQESLSFFWASHKTWDFEGSYTRSTVRSEIGYLIPQDLSAATSLYRDDAHSATALFHWNPPAKKLPFGKLEGVKLTAGGSMFISSGSRATRYYQPLATLLVPCAKHTSLFAEWRYYGYGEPMYLYEGFRAQLVTAGLRLSR
jgi:hypothetical protein